MNQIASLSAFAVVGFAQTATFTSKDIYGNILDQQSVEGTTGETFTATIDLGIAPKELSQLELGVGTYGVDSCDFYMAKKEGPKFIGSFEDMCAWPNVSTEGNNFLGMLNVRNLNQFKTHAKLTVECTMQDVTIKKVKPDGCVIDKPNTVSNNSLDEKVFNFLPVFRTKKAYMKEASFIYLTQFSKIFLGGANPAVDFWMDLHNYIVFKKALHATGLADGVKQSHKLMGGKKGKEMKSQSKQGQFGNETDRFLYKGAKIYGLTTFGVQTLADLFVMIQTYRGSAEMTANGKLDAVNETVFGWDKDNWHFYQMIQGNKEFNDEWHSELQFWYYAQAALQETVGLGQMIAHDTYYLPAVLPRLLKSYWELVAIGFMNTTA